MNAPPIRSRLQRLLRVTWFRITLGLFVCLSLTLAALPFAVKAGLTRWLVRHGAEQARIDRFSINPFLGRLSLQGLQVDKDGRAVLSNTRFELDLGLTGLLKRQIHVQRAVYEKLHLDLEQLPDGRWRLTSYTLPPAAAAAPTKVPEADSAWHFLASEVRLSDCLVHLKTPQLQLELAIEQAELARFTTQPGNGQGTFQLKGSVNGAPIEVALDGLAANPHPRLAGTVKVAGLGLNHLANLLAPVLPTFAGTTAVDGGVLFSQPAADAMEMVFDGRISLADGQLGNPAFSFTDTGLEWQGKVSYNANGPTGTVTAEGSLHGEALSVTLPSSGLIANGKSLLLKGPFQATFGDEVTVGNEAALTLTGLSLALPPKNLRHAQDTLLIEGKTDVTLGKGVISGFDGRIALGGAKLQLPTAALDYNALNWKGKIDFTDTGLGTVEFDGTLAGSDLSLSLPDEATTITQQALSLEPKGALTLGDTLGVKGTARLLAEQTKVTTAAGKEVLAALKKITVTSVEAPGGSTVAIKKVAAQGLEVNTAGDLPLTLHLPELDLDSLACTEWTDCAAQAIKADSLRVVGRRNDADLANLKTLAIERPRVAKDGQVAVTGLQLERLTVLPLTGEKNKNTLRLGRGRLSAASWRLDKGFRGETLILEDLVGHVIRQRDGQFQADKQLTAMRLSGQTEPSGVVAKNVPAAGSLIELGKISVRGASNLHFEDRSLAAPSVTDLAVQTLEMTDLSSRRPDQPAKVKLAAMLAQRAPLEITGTAKPFLPQPNIDLAFTLKNYPLSKLSPYTIQSVGLALASGQLNLVGSLVVNNGHINMKNGLILKKIETTTISTELAKQLDNRLPLPLETAISFLKDSNGDLKLDIPIQGPLSELEVGIADLLITALGKAIVPAASSYLVYSLGPYGALAYVGMKVGEKIMHASLAPVVFSPGKKELTSEHRDYLERVAKVLADRPSMEINLCPVVPAWELLSEKKRAESVEKEPTLREQEKEALNRLGQERAQAVIDHLVSAHGIAKGRLLICETVMPTDKDRKPEVELQL